MSLHNATSALGRPHWLRLAAGSLLLLLCNLPVPVMADTASSPDPFLWLEDVDGVRAMDWVRAENGKTLAALTADRRYPEFLASATAIAEATDRLPKPEFVDGQVMNFWQDASHVRGVWRTTSFDDYLRAQPSWRTTIDLDALATKEGKNWVWHGADCEPWRHRRCLIALSDGGEDAVSVREFDLSNGSFPSDGFQLDKSKQEFAWETPDALLVARDWGPGSMTSSGYPYIIKRVRRGQPVADAVEVYRGADSDVGVAILTQDDGAHHVLTLLVRNITFFESEYFVPTATGVVHLALPRKMEFTTLAAGAAIFRLKEEWRHHGKTYPAGALVALDVATLATNAADPHPTLVFAPGPRQSIGDVAGSRTGFVMTMYDNVRGRALAFTRQHDGSFASRPLTMPDNSSIELASVDRASGRAFAYVTGFLTPTSLWVLKTPTATPESVKTTPARFDAAGLVVEQRTARSNDGTEVPYFVVHRKDMKLDGSNPTVLYAYGGFEVSETPEYSAITGKLWLERGGVYVLANIRGGGEFGPAWHEAGLKTHRQRIYDDFRSVADDLIRRGITSPRRLGIQGGSNGGLLMGVEMTQHPELWNAVDIAVPLLDMLRFEQIAAGASWVGEYGSVANADERAFLASISPYHQLKPGVKYPTALVWTTTKDDRVGPQHARKYAARLAELGVPYYYYEVIEGGHGSGANLKEKAQTNALEMIYFTRQLAD